MGRVEQRVLTDRISNVRIAHSVRYDWLYSPHPHILVGSEGRSGNRGWDCCDGHKFHT